MAPGGLRAALLRAISQGSGNSSPDPLKLFSIRWLIGEFIQDQAIFPSLPSANECMKRTAVKQLNEQKVTP
jgi:hypothetical protein